MTPGRALAATVSALVLAGCGGAEPRVTRLDGEPENRPTLSIAQARADGRARHVLVRGYLTAPFDDRMRLCTRLDEGACEQPSLLVVGLDVERVEGLERGCCSIGYWSPHELSIVGTVARGVLFVDPQAV